MDYDEAEKRSENESTHIQAKNETPEIEGEDDVIHIHHEHETIEIKDEKEITHIGDGNDNLKIENEDDVIHIYDENETLKIKDEKEITPLGDGNDNLEIESEDDVIHLHDENETLKIMDETEITHIGDDNDNLEIENEDKIVHIHDENETSEMEDDNEIIHIHNEDGPAEAIKGTEISNIIKRVPQAQGKEPAAVIDLRNKMGIIYNVLKACMGEQNEKVYKHKDNIVNRLAYLTNLPHDVLSEISFNTKDFQNTEMLEESIIETIDIDYLIRQHLIDNYVKNHKIPRLETLMNITKDIHVQLKRSGYIWRRLGNTKKAIIVEHPKRAIQRQRYLQKIINFRKLGRPIVYIETKILNRANKEFHSFTKSAIDSVNFIAVFIVVHSNEGLLRREIFGMKSVFKFQRLFEDYIRKIIIRDLSTPCVLILGDQPYYVKTLAVPTIESDKSDMMQWLEINGLLYNRNLHRCELFELIQRCRGKSDLHEFDAAVQSSGHEILRRPLRTNYLNYYTLLWADVPVTEEAVTIFLHTKSKEFWKILENNLIRIEQSVLFEDSEMEQITDKILTMANNVDVKEWANTECDEQEDSLVQDEFIIEVKSPLSVKDMQLRDQIFLAEIKKITQNL